MAGPAMVTKAQKQRAYRQRFAAGEVGCWVYLKPESSRRC
jgi:hypothetical protein